jgi:ParB-like chromosome segregation protein Spo0J
MSDVRRDPKVKLGTLLKIRPDDVTVEENFNVRIQSAALEDHINAIKASIMMGDMPPPIAVRCVDGKIIVRDGHCRLEAYRRAIRAGTPVEFVDAVEWRGSDLDAIVFMVKSAGGKPLDPLEVAQAYKRLRSFNWTEAKIAERFSKTDTHVRQMLLLADAEHTVQEMVRAERIAASTAIKILQGHGANAKRIIDAAVAEATASGKHKVTPKHVKRVRGAELGGRPLPATAAMLDALRQLEQCMVEQRNGAAASGGAAVLVPAVLVDKLVSLGRDMTAPAKPALPTEVRIREREPSRETADDREMVAA